ncbi:MAG: TIGR00266 family protein [Oscillospiraceae bacterium]|nr:TIGR00266 family protein [Oscillospiraceae bacterium]MBR3861081.1 TIGR00266 family protein [Oscillospiraceae bacterium]
MKYEIKGEPLPVAICSLQPNESIICEAGAMCWMSPNMQMETLGGGAGKMLGRMFSGESLFQNRYTAKGGPGLIAVGSSFPGSIRAIQVDPAHPIVSQKRAFLAAEPGVELSVFFQKKMGAGFFGGEGFIMQQMSGSGLVFLEIDGSAVEYDLGPGEQIVADTGYVAMMDATCRMEVQAVKGIKNVLLGGEGLFNTVVTGPGHVVLQTMPLTGFAGAIASVLPRAK